MTHWWRPIQQLSLLTFDSEIESVPAAAIDTNVFRDIVEPRKQHGPSIALSEVPWLEDEIELVVTGQLRTEVHKAAKQHPALAGSASRFRELAPPPELWQPVFEEISASLAATSIEIGDVRHLAQAAAGNAKFFVTRDQPVLEQADLIESRTGLRIVAPAQLLLSIHSEQDERAYRPELLQETSYTITHPTSRWETSALVNFIDQPSGDRAGSIRAHLERAAEHADRGGRVWSIASSDSRPVAIASSALTEATLHVYVLRVQAGSGQLTLARQLVHRLRQEGAESGASSVEFESEQPGYVSRALAEEGFRQDEQDDARWYAPCRPGIIDLTSSLELHGATHAYGATSAAEVSELERHIWPAKHLTGTVPTYVVPIQPRWARALFGHGLQLSLTARPDHLGLSREHVYYRSAISTLEWPARLIWFVTGGGMDGGIRATSWLDDVVHGRPRTLFRRFGSQGVYKPADLEAIVRRPGGEATALLFSRTEALRRPIPLSRAKQIYDPIGSNQFLRTMRKVDEHVFGQVYREGTLYE
jgi:hypothetical protein